MLRLTSEPRQPTACPFVGGVLQPRSHTQWRNKPQADAPQEGDPGLDQPAAFFHALPLCRRLAPSLPLSLYCHWHSRVLHANRVCEFGTVAAAAAVAATAASARGPRQWWVRPLDKRALEII